MYTSKEIKGESMLTVHSWNQVYSELWITSVTNYICFDYTTWVRSLNFTNRQMIQDISEKQTQFHFN